MVTIGIDKGAESGDVEVMTICALNPGGAGFGALRSYVNVISDQNLTKGKRIFSGTNIFVSPDDFKKLRKMKKARTAIRFIDRLKEDFKNRPVVKPNIMKREA